MVKEECKIKWKKPIKDMKGYEDKIELIENSHGQRDVKLNEKIKKKKRMNGT